MGIDLLSKMIDYCVIGCIPITNVANVQDIIATMTAKNVLIDIRYAS